MWWRELYGSDEDLDNNHGPSHKPKRTIPRRWINSTNISGLVCAISSRLWGLPPRIDNSFFIFSYKLLGGNCVVPALRDCCRSQESIASRALRHWNSGAAVTAIRHAPLHRFFARHTRSIHALRPCRVSQTPEWKGRRPHAVRENMIG